MMGPLDKYQKYGINMYLTFYRSISLEILDTYIVDIGYNMASIIIKLYRGSTL